MKRTQLACLLAAGVAFAPLALAGPNTRDQIATVVPGACTFVQIAPFGTSLLANWSWTNGTIQTKFGGDAEFTIEASSDGGTTWVPLEIEFELVQFVPGTSAADYPGVMVYRCSTTQTSTAGTCNGSVLGVRGALAQAAADALAVDISLVQIRNVSLESVDVKAMNPGRPNGRQNYPLVNVCPD